MMKLLKQTILNSYNPELNEDLNKCKSSEDIKALNNYNLYKDMLRQTDKEKSEIMIRLKGILMKGKI